METYLPISTIWEKPSKLEDVEIVDSDVKVSNHPGPAKTVPSLVVEVIVEMDCEVGYG